MDEQTVDLTIGYGVYAAMLVFAVLAYAWPAMLILGAYGWAVPYWNVVVAWGSAMIVVVLFLTSLKWLATR